MKPILSAFLLVALNAMSCLGSNLYGGYIRHAITAQNSCEATIVTISGQGNNWPDQTAYLEWGDSTGSSITLDTSFVLENGLLENHYSATHVYSGPGEYLLTFEDPNWTSDIVNIPNSINVPLFTQSLVVIPDSFISKRSPKTQKFEIHKANLNQKFSLNLSMEGSSDNLRYLLKRPRSMNGVDINGYFIPNGVTIDSLSGLFEWESPENPGRYAFGFLVYECNGDMITSTTEVQLTVQVNSTNNVESIFQGISQWPQTSGNLPEYSLDPFDTLKLPVVFYDSLADSIQIECLGGAIQLNYYKLSIDSNTGNYLSAEIEIVGSVADLSCNPSLLTIRCKSYYSGIIFSKDVTTSIQIDDGNLSCNGCSFLLGSEQLKNRFKLSAFPNPVSDVLTVNSSGLTGNVFFEIFSLDGRRIHRESRNVNDEFIEIPVNFLSSGVYILHTQKNAESYNVKFIKQ